MVSFIVQNLLIEYGLICLFWCVFLLLLFAFIWNNFLYNFWKKLFQGFNVSVLGRGWMRCTKKWRISGKNYSFCYYMWSQSHNWHSVSLSSIHSQFPSPLSNISRWLTWWSDPNSPPRGSEVQGSQMTCLRSYTQKD